MIRITYWDYLHPDEGRLEPKDSDALYGWLNVYNVLFMSDSKSLWGYHEVNMVNGTTILVDDNTLRRVVNRINGN